jgi:dihydrofolate reductase
VKRHGILAWGGDRSVASGAGFVTEIGNGDVEAASTRNPVDAERWVPLAAEVRMNNNRQRRGKHVPHARRRHAGARGTVGGPHWRVSPRWPFATDEPGADELNAARKYVATTTLESADWNNSTVLRGDVVPQIAALKEEDGPEIQVHGSSNLIQTLLANDLVDEIHVMTFPVVVGGGKRLFGDGTILASFRVRDVSTSGTGVVMATYDKAGEVSVGSFALDQPTDLELQQREQWRPES